MSAQKSTNLSTTLGNISIIRHFAEDPRIKTAKSMLYGPDPIIGNHGAWQVYKATRSGGTTGIISEMVSKCMAGHNERFCAIVPTSIAAKDTVISGAMYSGLDDIECNEHITMIPANLKCIINEADVKKHKALKKLPMLPLGDRCIEDGIECEHFSVCPVTRILREGYKFGVVLTQHKLAALMLAKEMSAKYPDSMPSIPEQIIEYLSTPKNIIFDEAHKLECDDSRIIKIATIPDPSMTSKMDVYRSWIEDMPHMAAVLDAYEQILASADVRNAVTNLIKTYVEDPKPFKKHGSIQIGNPIGEKVISNSDEPDLFFINAYKEIMRCMRLAKNETDINEVLDLYTILCIIKANYLHVTNVRVYGREHIFLATVDHARNSMTIAYLRQMLRDKSKRVLIMSGTFGSLDYKDYIFSMDPITPVLFGPGGDPMNANDKMLLIANGNNRDRVRIWKNSLETTQLIDRIVAIINKFETNLSNPDVAKDSARWLDSVRIITTSIRHAEFIQDQLRERGIYNNVDYYNSDKTIAVAWSSRVLIAIGCAEKPMNAFDVFRPNKIESLRLRKEMVHADTWQAWSRVKDPSGTLPSAVFAFYCTMQECDDVSSWGYGRRIEVTETESGFEYKTCIENQCITKPKIVEIRNFEDIMSTAIKHMESYSRNVVDAMNPTTKEHENKPRGQYHDFLTILPKNYVTFYTKRDFLELFVTRWDTHFRQQVDGSYIKYDDIITADLIERHISGDITIGVLAIDPHHGEIANRCQWICIDIDAHIPDGVKSGWLNTQQKQLSELYNQFYAKEITIDELNPEEDRIRETYLNTEIEYLASKRAQSEDDRNKLKKLLSDHDIPYVLEASGTTGSYHFWIFLAPCEAKLAKSFGKDLVRMAGLPKNTEVNPKQTQVYSHKGVGYGNQVKMPLGLHRKHNVWSTIEVNGEFVRDFTEIKVGAIKINAYQSPFVADKKEYKSAQYGFVEASGVRPIFIFGQSLQLTGHDGHNFRMAMVREFYNNGMEDVEDLVNLFRNQEDFNPDKTRYHVTNILQTPFGCWRKETIEDKCYEIVERFIKSGGKW